MLFDYWMSISEWCTSNQYVCSNSRVCVDRVQVCNGELDCPNGDDEKNCVSIAPNVSQSDMMNYYSSGTHLLLLLLSDCFKIQYFYLFDNIQKVINYIFSSNRCNTKVQ